MHITILSNQFPQDKVVSLGAIFDWQSFSATLESQTYLIWIEITLSYYYYISLLAGSIGFGYSRPKLSRSLQAVSFRRGFPIASPCPTSALLIFCHPD